MLPIGDPVLIFTLLTIIILVSPLVAERIKMPDLVLLLLSGVLIGPKGFGIVESEAPLKLLGSVGLLYIMFLAGLEIDLHRFVQNSGKSVTFGLITFAIPQGIGTLVGRYLLGFDWQCSVLLASMFASHTLLAYPIASRLGISRSEPVAVTVGATIVTDTLALLVLAVIADSKRGVEMGPIFWLGMISGICLLIILIWFGIPRLSRWFFGNVTEEGGAQFLFVIATLCACSYISHFAKLEPIIGAFLAGAAFNSLIPQHSVLMNRVVFAGKTIFIPFFLISVGMLVDVMAIARDHSVWLVSAAMIAAVVGTKFAAAWMTGSIFGYGREAKNVMFGLSVVQAAATLAAVLVGYNLGIFDANVLNGAIAMIAVSCPLGAWCVEKYGRRMAAEMRPRQDSQEAEQRILVPVANPASARNILDLAFCIRDSEKPGEIDAITVVKSDNDNDDAVLDAEKILADCLAHANSAEMQLAPSVRIAPNSSDGVMRSARELRSSLVMLGWPAASSAQSRIFGSFAENLIDNCPQSLLFCRIVRPINMTRRLLVIPPPMADMRTGSKSLVSDIKFLSRQIGCDIKIFLCSKGSASFRKMLDSAKPTSPVSYDESDTMSEARTKLMAQVGPDDMILVLSERRTSAIWSPTLDRISENLVESFPHNNLLLQYPRMPQADEDLELATPAGDYEDFVEIAASELGEAYGLDAVVPKMLRDCVPGRVELTDEASNLLLACGRSYPVKLRDNIVLLHAHCERVSAPVLMVAMSSKPFLLPGNKMEARIILALLNPKSASPSAHLKTLAKIGRVFRDKDASARIAGAKSATEAASAIRSRM